MGGDNYYVPLAGLLSGKAVPRFSFRVIVSSACRRYRLSRRKQIIAEHFDATPFDEDWEPHSSS